MANNAIEIRNLGKQYRRREVGKGRYKTLRESLTSAWWKKQPKGEEDFFWALRHVNLEIPKGEIVGVIGPNGAGKSTLLKLLTRVTAPTEGNFTLRGRVASLLEVGTGFHPELTGRENIFLSGAIMGMKREEIKRKFDEIVAFSGVEQFLDLPVKRYSSGMFVRLGFAVAAHLEAEILLVDEVLAVGDAEFQKKCLGKIGDVAQNGRTVLFVSHNLGAVRQLCDSGILLNKGKVLLQKNIKSIIKEYENEFTESNPNLIISQGPLASQVNIKCLLINDQEIIINNEFIDGMNEIKIEIKWENKIREPHRLCIVVFHNSNRLFTLFDSLAIVNKVDNITSEFIIPAGVLRPGKIELAVGGFIGNNRQLAWFWKREMCFLNIYSSVWEEPFNELADGSINLINAKCRRI